MLDFFNKKTFWVLFIIVFISDLLAQARGCRGVAEGGWFRTYRGNGLFVPYSQYSNGRTCSEPLLYVINISWQIGLALIGTYLIYLDETEKKKRPKLLKKEMALETRLGVNNLKRNRLIKPIALLSVVIFYFLGRNNMYKYGFWIIAAPMLITLVASFILIFPKRNNPNYPIYYLFHQTRFVKVGVLAGIIFIVFIYFDAQCGASYDLPLGKECIDNLSNEPSTFFRFLD